MSTDESDEDDELRRTRAALHTVAEHVLAAALYAATGHIGLRRTPGGFGTPWFKGDTGERRARVEGIQLVVEDTTGERRADLTTVRAAAALVGITPGAPADVYTPATPLDLDASLRVEPISAHRLADWYALIDAALDQLRGELAGDEPSPAQLWPEHFDLATTIAEVNYGGSPGDASHALPYLYVGPFTPRPPDGDYWNEAFGASVGAAQAQSVDDALAFFRRGRFLTTG